MASVEVRGMEPGEGFNSADVRAAWSHQRIVAVFALSAAMLVLPLATWSTLRFRATQRVEIARQHAEIAAFARSSSVEAQRGAGVAFHEPEPAYRGQTTPTSANQPEGAAIRSAQVKSYSPPALARDASAIDVVAALKR